LLLSSSSAAGRFPPNGSVSAITLKVYGIAIAIFQRENSQRGENIMEIRKRHKIG
jgi:hypothetical protein